MCETVNEVFRPHENVGFADNLKAFRRPYRLERSTVSDGKVLPIDKDHRAGAVTHVGQ
jgi:hypothetical protein